MSLQSRIKSNVASLLFSKGVRSTVRNKEKALRAIRGGQRRATFFHRVDDPYSYLLAQALLDLHTNVPIEFRMLVLPAPDPSANPEPAMLKAYSPRDAVILANRFGLSFPSQWHLPSEDRIRRAQALLFKERPIEEQLRLAVAMGKAIFTDDHVGMAELVENNGAAEGLALNRLLEENHNVLCASGHYQGGMLHYEGEWYWGVDRLHYLQERLAEEGVATDIQWPEAKKLSSYELLGLGLAKGEPNELEVFVSFRSPYSYLAIQQLRLIEASHDVSLKLRPVLPMVTRGLVVPRAKQFYIMRDTKRESERVGIPFGNFSDPLGDGVSRCFAVFVYAEERGKGLEFLESASKGIWNEAVEVSSDEGLMLVSERIGLTREDVNKALADDGWERIAESNRQAMVELGIWGVPSFKLGRHAIWGHDRLSILMEMLENNRT